MADWTAPMQQTFEYYTVDPGTWKDVRKLDTITSSSITRDADAETLGSASFDTTGLFEESYVRTYLVTDQNGIREKFPLATMLVQTPSVSFDGRVQSGSVDAYTPLIELKENEPPLGYYVPEGANVMNQALTITRDHLRAPVVGASSDVDCYKNFVANTDDTWLTFLTDLIANAKFEFAIDEMGRILFAPKQDIASLQPVWTFTDDNSSILYPDIDVDHDLFEVPNVVEVVYSDSRHMYVSRVVNNDPNSDTSTVRRGREITKRITNPDLTGVPTQRMLDDYAKQQLRDLSAVDRKITFQHGYCPIRLGDCIRINYTRSGVVDVKAKVTQQSIECTPGAPVKTTAVYTVKYWG